jgi:hypothetical protein
LVAATETETDDMLLLLPKIPLLGNLLRQRDDADECNNRLLANYRPVSIFN